jgi:hypothetical protein
MEPFWQTHQFANIIEWITAVILFILTFSPFIAIAFKRFRPTRWYHIVLLYVASPAMFALGMYLIGLIDSWLGRKIGFTYIVIGLTNAIASFMLWLFVFWPMSVFYCVRLLKGPFNLKTWLVALLLAILVFVLLAAFHIFVLLPFVIGGIIGYF